MKATTKVLFRGKKLLKLRFLDYFFKVETVKCDQEDWSISDEFGIIAPCLATLHLEVVAPVLLKAAIKASLISKTNAENLDFQATFLKQKGKIASKKFGVTQHHIFWKWVHAFH